MKKKTLKMKIKKKLNKKLKNDKEVDLEEFINFLHAEGSNESQTLKTEIDYEKKMVAILKISS